MDGAHFCSIAALGVLRLIYVSLALPVSNPPIDVACKMYLQGQGTTGRSLEELDKAFERPWYTMHQVP
ncbi:hypothetical protein BDW66DRAFT_144230 [Aspergillus desertorum]